MTLEPLDTPERLRLAAEWLSQKENTQWLDFGDSRQKVTPEWLKLAVQRGAQAVRIFTSDDGAPIGVVGLGNINRDFRTATLWVILGDKSAGRRGYATRAVSRMVGIGFRELGLNAINTWVVEHNPSLRVAERSGFRPFGRQRQCHYIDGRAYDRIWFDMLSSEHREL